MDATHIGTAEYLNDDGIQKKIVGWHQYQKRRRYLVRCSRPEAQGPSIHVLVDIFWMPRQLLKDFNESEKLNIGNAFNQGAEQIRLENITQVLDMAWCSQHNPDCSSMWIDDPVTCSKQRFDDIFLLLQWKDEDGASHKTWEIADTLMRLMGEDRCISLLACWAHEIDRRHNQLLTKALLPTSEVALGRPGWQYV